MHFLEEYEDACQTLAGGRYLLGTDLSNLNNKIAV